MKRSALARIGSLIGIAYLLYLGFVLYTSKDSRVITLRLADYTIGLSILPLHTLSIIVATLLNGIAWLAKKRGVSLAAAILYALAAPLTPSLFAIPVALSLMALAGFLWFPAQTGKGQPAEAETDPALEMLDEPVPGEEDAEAMELDTVDDSADLEDDADLALDDGSDDDLLLEPLSDDEEPEKRHPSRSGADGMAVFLGLFMGLAALALIGMVIYGVTGGKLPFLS